MIPPASRPNVCPITPPDWTILSQVERYRALTVRLLHRLTAEDLAWDALRMRLERLRRNGWLRKSWLIDHQACYVLGIKTERLCGRHQHRGFPFGAHALLQHLAIAHFAVYGDFTRLLPSEFQEQFPDCERRGLPANNYCLSRTNDELAWLIVDHAAAAARFPQKLAKFVAKRRGLPGFERLLDAGRLRAVIITATEEKRSRIEKAIEERPIAYLPTSIVAIPELTQFLF